MELTARVLRLRLVDEHGAARITPELLDRLHEGLEKPGGVVVLEGDGDTFNEGLDLGALSHEGAAEAGGRAFSRLLDALGESPRPVVALVEGAALGAGCALAAAADLVIASPGATFGLPEVLWGLIPAVAFRHVARRIGVPRTRLLALTGASIDAQEAHRFGLVDVVAPDLEATLASYVKRFSRADARALGEVKALAALLEGDDDYVEPAVRRFCELAKSPTTRARVARFESSELPWGDAP